jgi:hypothetical protein
MKAYLHRDCADASVKAAGVWLHIRGTLLGIAPDWWFKDHRRDRPSRVLGISILTPAHWHDRRIAFSIRICRREWGVMRDQIDARWRLIEG